MIIHKSFDTIQETVRIGETCWVFVRFGWPKWRFPDGTEIFTRNTYKYVDITGSPTKLKFLIPGECYVILLQRESYSEFSIVESSPWYNINRKERGIVLISE